ncbi:MAG: hypothetical protein QNJ33_11190 [Crocosphaera sp.]|nr:hypothetical protein [Crocosphaera sp.]
MRLHRENPTAIAKIFPAIATKIRASVCSRMGLTVRGEFSRTRLKDKSEIGS